MGAEIRQQYKNRAEAYALFIQPSGYGVKRAKFYEDCLRLKIVQQDKTLFLADLLAYAKSELEIAAGDSRSLADEEHAAAMRKLDLREKEATVLKKEREALQFDDRYMEVLEHDKQMGAFSGRLDAALQQLTTIKLPTLIHVCGGDQTRAAELNQALEDLYAAAMTDAVSESHQVVVFEAEEVGDDDAVDGD